MSDISKWLVNELKKHPDNVLQVMAEYNNRIKLANESMRSSSDYIESTIVPSTELVGLFAEVDENNVLKCYKISSNEQINIVNVHYTSPKIVVEGGDGILGVKY